MSLITILLIAFVALEHLYFLVLEMFLWTSSAGMRAFGIRSKEFAESTKVIAANQGLYNGFLAAGLGWSIIDQNTTIAFFFLGCVILAGIFGAASTKKIKLFYVQSIPAILAVLTILFN